MSVALTNGDGFEKLLNSKGIAFVDFWAEWCGPCKSFAKTFENVSEQYPNITFASIDIEKESELAATLVIRSVPHLIVIKDGVVIYSDAGAVSKSALEELVTQAIDADVSTVKVAD